MRKIIMLSLYLFISTELIYSQTNTFPTSGNVGIGTTTPLEELHIQNGNLLLSNNLSSLTMGTIKFSTNAYNYAWSGISGVSNGQGWDQMDLLFYTAFGGPSEKMRLMANTGYLGIGTSTPAAKVHSMSTGEQLRLGYDANNYSAFTTSSTGGLLISPSGKTFSLLGQEIYFDGYQSGQNQNSNSARLNFIGDGETAGFGIQALNSAYYGTKDLVFYAHNGIVHNDYTSYDEVVRFRYDGSVGIGTSTPQAKLDVNGNIYSNGKIFIGTPDANTATKIAPYSLAVNGSAVFTKAVVKLNSAWPDYVFSPTYKLIQLDSLEQFIKSNGHLPEIPKAETVEKEGLDLGNSQALLLKKIEELTLIVIEQNKRIEKLEKENQVNSKEKK
ncbi:MAG TPA: hypothetical protein VFI29_14955 [Hanamia sp.]|nr:hypothetical protein [Hanamia sp.]